MTAKFLAGLFLAFLTTAITSSEEQLPRPESPLVVVFQGGRWVRVRTVEDKGGALVYMELSGGLVSAPKQMVDLQGTATVNEALSLFAEGCSAEEKGVPEIPELQGIAESVFETVAEDHDRTCLLRLHDAARTARLRAVARSHAPPAGTPVPTPTREQIQVTRSAMMTLQNREDYTISIETSASGDTVEVRLDTNIPGVIEVMVSIDLKGQAPTDVYIGKVERVRIVKGTATHRFNISDLPTGDYEAEVAFYPQWGFQDEESRATDIEHKLKAAVDIRLGGSGQTASAVQFRENSQRWVMENIGIGSPWNEGEWTKRFGSFETLPVEGLMNPDIVKPCYFPAIDMTIFVNTLNSTVALWRIGRATR